MDDAARAAWLCSAPAIRTQCRAVLDGIAAPGAHFRVHAGRLAACADYTAAVIRSAYPTLDIPHHARWRHFAAGGIDRWAALRARLGITDPAELARLRTELCIVSVLLDAGAGPAWRYHEAGRTLSRSEGLGVASLHAFEAGLFGAGRVDAATLAGIDARALGAAFQVSDENPLAGLEGRAALLRRLGAAVQARPDIFAGGRLGGLFDTAADPAPAPRILHLLLDGLGPIWPPRLTLAGRPLGDVWPHPHAPGGLVPFHKLSQWLTYSLIEVFEDAGVAVPDTGALTGLPEYRNGGLLLDLGVLEPVDPALPSRLLAPGDPAVVEWRALTVALLDELAPLLRDRLGRDLPLSRLLEGGTWAAGRAIAAERRQGGPPPLRIDSDGTVF